MQSSGEIERERRQRQDCGRRKRAGSSIVEAVSETTTALDKGAEEDP